MNKPGIDNTTFIITLDSSTFNTIPSITISGSDIIYNPPISSDAFEINKDYEYKELEDVYKLYLSKFRLKDNEKNFTSFIEDIFYIINENRAVKYQIDKINYGDFEHFYIVCSNPIVSFDTNSLYYFIKAETLPILKQRLEELNIEIDDRMD